MYCFRLSGKSSGLYPQAVASAGTVPVPSVASPEEESLQALLSVLVKVSEGALSPDEAELAV